MLWSALLLLIAFLMLVRICRYQVPKHSAVIDLHQQNSKVHLKHFFRVPGRNNRFESINLKPFKLGFLTTPKGLTTTDGLQFRIQMSFIVAPRIDEENIKQLHQLKQNHKSHQLNDRFHNDLNRLITKQMKHTQSKTLIQQKHIFCQQIRCLINAAKLPFQCTSAKIEFIQEVAKACNDQVNEKQKSIA